eukprot:SAG25_NODE_10374_length_337_cov_0.596639_1_plen_21_part_10
MQQPTNAEGRWTLSVNETGGG